MNSPYLALNIESPNLTPVTQLHMQVLYPQVTQSINSTNLKLHN